MGEVRLIRRDCDMRGGHGLDRACKVEVLDDPLDSPVVDRVAAVVADKKSKVDKFLGKMLGGPGRKGVQPGNVRRTVETATFVGFAKHSKEVLCGTRNRSYAVQVRLRSQGPELLPHREKLDNPKLQDSEIKSVLCYREPNYAVGKNSPMGARHLAKAHSLAEHMFLELRFGVLSARYLPGQIIPKGELGDLYECRPAAVAKVLNALASEGYFTRHSRSEFVVRTWGADEIEDLFEMRANLEGHAAFRAATRASAAEISLLGALVAEAREPALDSPDDLERVIHENLRFHIEVMRMSRIPQAAEMARMALPNALHRRIAWSQRSDDAEQSFRMHQKIATAIAERSTSLARLMMREDIYSAREAVLAAIAAMGSHEGEVASVARLAPTLKLNGRVYGQGTREAGADGHLVPFGVPARNMGA